MVVLRLSGNLSLEHADGSVVPAGARQRRRLELLALLALAGPRGMGRGQLQGLLWPDKSEGHASHALEQLVYLVRRDLGRDAIVADGLTLRLDPAHVTSDVAEFDTAVAAGDLVRAAGLWTGPLLDGIRLGRTPELERWLDEQREAWKERHARVLERLAHEAERCAAYDDAAELWRRRTSLDPYDAPATLGLMRALVASGDPARAIRQARVYESLVRNELELVPDAAVVALATSLSLGPSEVAARRRADAIAQTADVTAIVGIRASAELRRADLGAPPTDRPSRGAVALTIGTPRSRAMAAGVVAMLAISVVVGATRHAVLAARGTRAPAATSTISVAVLPFRELDARREGDFIRDGLTDELINALGRVPGLRVAARTSVFALKGSDADAREIGRRLGVRVLIEGGVRHDDDEIHVAVRLVDATTGYQLHAMTFDRPVLDAPALQREIAASVAQRLLAGGGVARPARPAPTAADTPSYAAFEHFLRGSYYLNQRGGAARAVDELRAAISADPRYARAYAGLAEAYNMLAEARSGRAEQATLLARAEVAARRATRLDPPLADAHTALGNFLLNQWNWEEAASEFRRAIAANPSYARGYARYAILLALRGDFDSSLAMLRHARELDPLSVGIRETHAYVLYLGRRHREAEAVSREIIALDSSRESARFRLGTALLGAGRYADAAHQLAAAARLTPNGPQRALPMLGYAYARAGRMADARRLQPVIERGLTDHSVSPYFAAAYFGALGERDRALVVLEELGSERETCLRDLAVDPVMDALRTDPRFDGVLAAIGMAPVRAEGRE